jgi:hypothetical protein
MIEATSNPKQNLKDEVTALHEVYLQRKSILQDIDAKYNALRHQQRMLAREGTSHRVRASRPTKAMGSAVVVPVVLADAISNVQDKIASTTQEMV